jgi:hypothetical protein
MTTQRELDLAGLTVIATWAAGAQLVRNRLRRNWLGLLKLEELSLHQDGHREWRTARFPVALSESNHPDKG